jgi:hypothetical protein
MYWAYKEAGNLVATFFCLPVSSGPHSHLHSIVFEFKKSSFIRINPVLSDTLNPVGSEYPF